MQLKNVILFAALAALPAWGQGRGGVFPAMQRPPGDPAVIARGKTIYSTLCSACHGVDARGGQLGGPNLLRSQLVLRDKEGELVVPVIQTGRPERGMPPQPLSDDDSKAVAAFLHSLLAASAGQGSPPPAEIPPLNIVVGDAAAGQTYFAAKCASCHSTTGDLQGIATRIADPKILQNTWVPGSGRGRGRSSRATMTATVTLPSGDKAQGTLVRYDDFSVTLMDADGNMRTFRRDGDKPKLEINDPLHGHKSLLTVLTDKEMHDVTAYLVTLK